MENNYFIEALKKMIFFLYIIKKLRWYVISLSYLLTIIIISIALSVMISYEFEELEQVSDDA